MIAAGVGYNESVKGIQQLYMAGLATKADYTCALRAYQKCMDDIKSPQRDQAAKFTDRYKYYLWIKKGMNAGSVQNAGNWERALKMSLELVTSRLQVYQNCCAENFRPSYILWYENELESLSYKYEIK